MNCNKLTKDDFKILFSDFLVETEKLDETKPEWMIKNHVHTLHSSLNEFYLWLEENYWGK